VNEARHDPSACPRRGTPPADGDATACRRRSPCRATTTACTGARRRAGRGRSEAGEHSARGRSSSGVALALGRCCSGSGRRPAGAGLAGGGGGRAHRPQAGPRCAARRGLSRARARARRARARALPRRAGRSATCCAAAPSSWRRRPGRRSRPGRCARAARRWRTRRRARAAPSLLLGGLARAAPGGRVQRRRVSARVGGYVELAGSVRSSGRVPQIARDPGSRRCSCSGGAELSLGVEVELWFVLRRGRR
jgi:hypothetical protein